MDFRTLDSIEQVRSIPGYRVDNPVNQNNYKALLKDYQFKAQEHCCYLRDDGALCRTLHNHGYVVELADNSISIIGNDCAKRYFDAESQLSKDRVRFANEKRRQESLIRLRDLLVEKDDKMEVLRKLDQQIRHLHAQMAAFDSAVGSRCMNRLHRMAKDGRREVTVTGIRLRPYVEDGVQRQERTAITITVSALQGLSILRIGVLSGLSERVHAIVRAYHKAEHTLGSATTRDLEHMVTSLNDLASLRKDCEDLQEAARTFWGSDLSFLSFLVDDFSERVKIVQHAHSGTSASSAKRWLAMKEQELKTVYNVQRIEVQM